MRLSLFSIMSFFTRISCRVGIYILFLLYSTFENSIADKFESIFKNPISNCVIYAYGAYPQRCYAGYWYTADNIVSICPLIKDMSISKTLNESK